MALMQDRRSTVDVRGATYDEGLRAYMLRVYNYMASGVALTGIVAMLTASSESLMMAIFGTPLQWVIFGAVILYGFFVLPRIQTMSQTGAQLAFWGYASLLGVFLSSIAYMYTGESIARVFFISAALFGSMSLYGYTSKKDLSSWGSFFVMGMWGLLIAIVVNIFLQSTMMQLVISCVGVLMFTGMTAYDTQNIKRIYYGIGAGGAMLQKATIIGALQLYSDFIGIFIYLMHLLGDRR